MQRVLFALFAGSIAALLTACADKSLTAPGGLKTSTIANVSSKTTAELYADVIAPARMERPDTKIIDGYTVETAALTMPADSKFAAVEGSLVTVRSPDGSLFAIINEPGKKGTLQINSKGESSFYPDDTRPASEHDIVEGMVEQVRQIKSNTTSVSANSIIDIFVIYTRNAYNSGAVNKDLHADALARIALVNRALSNSQIWGVSLKLVGTKIYESFVKITQETLDSMGGWFLPEIEATGADLVTLFVGPDSVVVEGWMTIHGLAYAPGRVSISNAARSEFFAHEIGHNVGGLHCNAQGGSDWPYGYGYETMTLPYVTTIQCGDMINYYSSPDVIYNPNYTTRLGRAGHSDMARLWRERAPEMAANRTPPKPEEPEPPKPIPEAPTGFKETGSNHTSISFSWNQTAHAVRYEVMVRETLLPTLKKVAESTTTQVVANNVPKGLRQYFVVAVNGDGVKSKVSNVVFAKPYSTQAEPSGL